MLVIFFIKQKTAYEMRISDWSADVCSSDLLYPPPAQGAHFGYPRSRKREPRDDCRVAPRGRRRLSRQYEPRRSCRPCEGDRGDPRARKGHRAPDNDQIGRASCRERVGQYVSIAVVAVSIKTHTYYRTITLVTTSLR